MPRSTSENPRTIQITFRITEADNEILEAIAALDRINANEVAHQYFLGGIKAAQEDDLVQTQLDLHRRRESRVTNTVVPFDGKRQAALDGK